MLRPPWGQSPVTDLQARRWEVEAGAFLAAGRPGPVPAPLVPRSVPQPSPSALSEAEVLAAQLGLELGMEPRQVLSIAAGRPGHRPADVERVLVHLIRWHPELTLCQLPGGGRSLRRRRHGRGGGRPA